MADQSQIRGNDLLTTLIVLPMMLSPAVVGNFWTFLYQPQIGLVNYVVELVTGTPASSFSMLGPGGFAPWSIVIVDVWMWDALCHADLPCGTAVYSRLHL